MPRFNVLTVGFVATAAFAACSFEPKSGPTGGTNPSQFDASGGVDRIYVAGDLGGITGDACPMNNYMANNLPPDLLIVLDRSGSMREDMTGMMCPNNDCGANSKWAQMTTAIKAVVMQSQGMVNWGLKFFGTGSSGCAVANTTAVDPATMTAAAIIAAIDAPANQPATSTPTRAAEISAGNYLDGRTNANPKYILLATDGEPNCAESGGMNATDGPGAIAAVTSVAALGFPTFVIGIAADDEAGTTLEGMAIAGGRPRAGGNPSYYSVTTTADLQAALTAIQSMTALPCQFSLAGVPSNPGAVTVVIGGQAVPMGDWMYGPGMRSIVFPDAGATCTMLKSGAIQNVAINLPCGDVLIP